MSERDAHPDPSDAAHPGPEEQSRRDRHDGSPPDADPATEVARLRARVTEVEDLWRRALADLDNLRKRTARDAASQQAAERARAALEWLPVLDNLDLALQHSTADPATVIQGIQAVRDQALSVLAGLGYPRRDDTGDTFDPARHEAVATVATSDVEAGSVVHVVRPGYGDGERQLRPAAVVVATRSAPEAAPRTAGGEPAGAPRRREAR